jgi:hypothetical protein
MGVKLNIRGPDGVIFHGLGEQVNTDPVAVREAMQSARPMPGSFDTAMGNALKHRSGVDVHARTLRKTDSPGNADEAVNLIDALALGKGTFLPATPQAPRSAIENSLKVARGYILDSAASYRIGQLCVSAAKLIADSQEFARLPYPVVWAELDQRSVLEGMKSRGGQVLDEAIAAPDERLGFLYTGHGVYSASKTKGDANDSHAGWSPFAIRMGRPMTAHQMQRWQKFMGHGPDTLDRFLWGNAYNDLDRTRRKALRYYSGLDILLPDSIADGPEPAPLARLLEGGGAGDWKLALAILLVLIRPGIGQHHELRKPQRRLTAKGMRKLVGLTTVTINISARKTKSLLKKEYDDARRGVTRWHEVRGHYVHNRVSREADCIHDWDEVEPNRWTCRHCGGKRAWREYPNGRGSIEAGAVAKHYRVTSKGTGA